MNILYIIRPYLLGYVFPVIPIARGFFVKAALLRLVRVDVGVDAKVSSRIQIYGRGHIKFGDKSWIGSDIKFIVPFPARVLIGANCDLAQNISFVCGSHKIGDYARRAGEGTVGDIEVGDGTWIGHGVTILPDTKIGKGCIVAAGAVVLSGDYQANSLIAGVPAKIIRNIEASGCAN